MTTFWLLHAGNGEAVVTASVFCVGLSMSAAYPTLLGLVGDAFPNGTGTAIGLVTTGGWAGLGVSSSLIGLIAGVDESNLGRALSLFPVFSLALIGVSLALRRELSTDT